MPDPETFPVNAIADIVSKALKEQGGKLLQYGLSEGLLELREQLLDFMSWRGLKVHDVEKLLVTCGSQKGLDIIGRVMINKGDPVLVELPTYLAAINAFKMYEPEFIGLRMDDEGIKRS